MEQFLALLDHCRLCPRRCGADRSGGERGFCEAGSEVVVSHYGPHFGEEPPISGHRGSGNVFFSPCNLRCSYCQNYQISHTTFGEALSVERLIDIFFDLQSRGVHNINLVSPTPYIPHIAAAIRSSRAKGFRIPFVYNTNAYETGAALRLLDGLVDIYLPDFKYWNNRIGKHLSQANGYRFYATEAITEMKRQVGNLLVEGGIAYKGLLIRHLVLPAKLAGTKDIIRWVKKNLGAATFISLMSQYYPVYKAGEFRLLDRRIREDEYDDLVILMKEEGFENVFLQELDSAAEFLPDFNEAEPFSRSEGKKVRR
jgi:putative pyruvate formate lyase activating enzyme